MRFGWHLLIASTVAVGGCVTHQQPTKPDIYVMRHLNTPTGMSDPDLTAQGQQSAHSLAGWFKRDKPGVIYVSSTKRAQQTAAPLANALGLTPKIYNPADTAALVTAVTAEERTVLVVGHSNTVPEIIERLGGKRPTSLDHEDFGSLWKIDGRSRQTQMFTLFRSE